MPALRQAAPVHSLYVEALSDCHWKCKLCKADILAAVISAGAIRHFRTEHPNQLHDMQYELCKVLFRFVFKGVDFHFSGSRLPKLIFLIFTWSPGKYWLFYHVDCEFRTCNSKRAVAFWVTSV